MGISKIIRLFLALVICFAVAGCGADSANESGNPNTLDNLKARSAGVNEYSCDFRRQFGQEEVLGRIYYKDENIRFEMFGPSPEDMTVTIVNQDKDKTYTFNTKMAKGAIQEPAAFLLDVPLPGEIMSVLNIENCSFIGQPERDGQKCTAFRANEAQFFGYKFSGEIVIANESGLPVYISGSRDSIPLTFEYRNYSTSELPISTFSPPENIEFK